MPALAGITTLVSKLNDMDICMIKINGLNFYILKNYRPII